MKRITALKNLVKILQRMHGINGIYNTPMEHDICCKIQRAWLFGSVLKGSKTPNDIDIFIEIVKFDTPKHKETKSRKKTLRSYARLHGGYRPCRRSRKWRTGKFHDRVDSRESFIIWLRKHIPNISIHIVGNDITFDVLDDKCLIYPRCDFDFDGLTPKELITTFQNKRPLP